MPAHALIHHGERQADLGQIGIDAQGIQNRRRGLAGPLRFAGFLVERPVGPAQAGVCPREAAVLVDRALEQADGVLEIARHVGSLEKQESLRVVRKGLLVRRRRCDFRWRRAGGEPLPGQRRRQALGDLTMEREQLRGSPSEVSCRGAMAVTAHEIDVDFERLSIPLNAAFDDERRTERAGGPRRVQPALGGVTGIVE